MAFLLQTINILADLLITLIFVRVVLSWIVRDPSHRLMQVIAQLTEPILGPIRRSIPRLGMFDLSPLLAFFLIEFVRNLLNKFLYML